MAAVTPQPKRAEERGNQTPEKGWKTWQEQNPRPPRRPIPRRNRLRQSLRQQRFEYQSECHCSKTGATTTSGGRRFEYQSECHCSKTQRLAHLGLDAFEYQSECHCSKTVGCSSWARRCLSTSQNVTAPKLPLQDKGWSHSLSTSQNVTAPKPGAAGTGW